jgi:hypothetical protein
MLVPLLVPLRQPVILQYREAAGCSQTDGDPLDGITPRHIAILF